MFVISAFTRTMVLLAAMLLMAGLWGFAFMPGANLLVVVFAFLSSALLVDLAPFGRRLQMILLLACYCAGIQLLISLAGESPLLQLVLALSATYFAFATLPDYRYGCMVMLVGFLSFFAPSGWEWDISRSVDILAGSVVVMAVTALGNAGTWGRPGNAPPSLRYSPYQSLILTAELGIGMVIYNVLQWSQGAWIMLTILFIRMCDTAGGATEKLVFQRMIAVPCGIVIGGFLLGTFCRIDTRFVYLVPFIGASGFFILYKYGSFFWFTIVFMITLTFFTDWMAGPYRQFYFWDSLAERSGATVLGALLELFLGQKQDIRHEEGV